MCFEMTTHHQSTILMFLLCLCFNFLKLLNCFLEFINMFSISLWPMRPFTCQISTWWSVLFLFRLNHNGFLLVIITKQLKLYMRNRIYWFNIPETLWWEWFIVSTLQKYLSILYFNLGERNANANLRFHVKEDKEVFCIIVL